MIALMIALPLGLALAQEPPQASPVRSKQRVEPVFPEAAKSLNITEAVCKVRFKIDEAGLPVAVDVLECPEIFKQATLDAAWKWTFYPTLVDGVPVKATFVLTVKYRLEGDAGIDAAFALDLGAGLRSGAAFAVHFSLTSAAVDHLYRSVSVTTLLGPKHEGQPVSLWREDVVLGPQLWAGPARLALYTGLGVDRWGGASSLRLPVGATAMIRLGEPCMVQVSAQPSLVFLGDASRKQPGLIDELAVEGGLWIAPWSDPGAYRAGIHLSGGWLDWPEERVIYGGIGLGGNPAATPHDDAAAR